MTWENLLKISFGSNEGYNKLMWAAEIIKEMKMALELDESDFKPAKREYGLITAPILQRIKDEEVSGYSNPEVKKILDSGIEEQLEILANLFLGD